jgi:TRAP-type C4-dicarboxylate transport system substrate-binding protein
MTAAKLEALGIKLSDWAKLPGELRNEILQAAEEGEPEEYRGLIRRYFQKVAKRGGIEEEGR